MGSSRRSARAAFAARKEHWTAVYSFERTEKREETRERRFAQLLADCTARKKLAHLIPPVGKGRRATSREA